MPYTDIKLRFKKGVLLLSICFFIPFVSTAQNEYNFYGKGARAAGMGYAFNAISDDATAMTWNPAGMTQIKKPEFALAGSMKFASYTHSVISDIDYKPVFTLDYLGFVYPVKLKKRTLVLGANFQTLINYKENYNKGNRSELSEKTYKNNLTVNTFSLCGAYPFTQYLSLGLSFNAWFSLGNASDYYAWYNSKEIYDGEREDEYQVIENKTYGYSGVDMSVGFLTDFSKFNIPLRFAFNFRTESIIKNKYKATYQSENIYEMAADTIYLESFDGPKKYYYHRIFAFGLSYRINDYFTISCDFDFRPFKNAAYSWDYQYYDDSETPPVDTTMSEVYYISEANENLNQFRIGAEYVLHPKFALIPIRIGWKNNPTTFLDYNENGEAAKQMYASSINFGTGLIMDRFSVDLAYEWYAWERMDDDYDYEKKTNQILSLSVIVNL